MNQIYHLEEGIEILERTPRVILSLLSGLSKSWIYTNEGPETFSPFDVVGHLIHGEKTDWIARLNKVLGIDTDKNFEPYDRFAQYEESKGSSMQQLLNNFLELRAENLNYLKGLSLTESDFNKTGMHPAFGEVTCKQLLATWVAHDLSHIAQIARVMAKRYSEEVGPWKAFLPILHPRS